MKKIINRMGRYRVKTVIGILVQAPVALRPQNIDFMLIGEDGIEYHIKGSRKTFQMWSLVNTRLQVTGITNYNYGNSPRVSVVAYKCIDDFNNTEALPLEQVGDFDIQRLDYAI